MKRIIALWLCLGLLLGGLTTAAAEGDSWICPGCGTENTAKFCTECGTKRPEKVHCPGCGFELPADHTYKFCPECGTPLTAQEAKDEKEAWPAEDKLTVRHCGVYYLTVDDSITSSRQVQYVGCLVDKGALPKDRRKVVGFEVFPAEGVTGTHVLSLVKPDGEILDWTKENMNTGTSHTCWSTVGTDADEIPQGEWKILFDGELVRTFTVSLYGGESKGEEFVTPKGVYLGYAGMRYSLNEKDRKQAASINYVTREEAAEETVWVSVSVHLTKECEGEHVISIVRESDGVVFFGMDGTKFSRGADDTSYSFFSSSVDADKLTGYYSVYIDGQWARTFPILVEGETLPDADTINPPKTLRRSQEPDQSAGENPDAASGKPADKSDDLASFLNGLADDCMARIGQKLQSQDSKMVGWMERDLVPATATPEGSILIRITREQMRSMRAATGKVMLSAGEIASLINGSLNADYRQLAEKTAVPYQQLRQDAVSMEKGSGLLLLRFYPFNCLLMLVDETLGYSGALVMSEPNMIGKMNQTVLAEYAASLGVKDLADYEVLP